MGKSETHPTQEGSDGEEVLLTVDDRGRVTLPKEIRDRLGIEPDDTIPARLVGSVLEMDPKPSAKLQTATAGREDWENTTPTDAGESLFGPMESE
jgi:AbrB family looped-hinge helix DNA binding protein